MMDHVARISYAKRVFSYAYTHAFDRVACTRDTDTSWRQLMQTQACRYVCIYARQRGGEGDSVNYSSLWFPYPLGVPLEDRYPISPPSLLRPPKIVDVILINRR